jgi:hypothetical protein
LAVLAVITFKEIFLATFAILWVVFFLSPFTLYSKTTRSPMTPAERAVMVALGLALVVTLWYSLPNR